MRGKEGERHSKTEGDQRTEGGKPSRTKGVTSREEAFGPERQVDRQQLHTTAKWTAADGGPLFPYLGSFVASFSRPTVRLFVRSFVCSFVRRLCFLEKEATDSLKKTDGGTDRRGSRSLAKYPTEDG